jgi:hypothetical protein
VTHLRKRMLEELHRRNHSEGTTRAYLQAIQQFAVHFGKSPDKLEPDDLRSYQAYLLVVLEPAWQLLLRHVGYACYALSTAASIGQSLSHISNY